MMLGLDSGASGRRPALERVNRLVGESSVKADEDFRFVGIDNDKTPPQSLKL